MSRPCTDLPTTRVSVTNDVATVVEVVVDDGVVVDVVTIVDVAGSVDVVVVACVLVAGSDGVAGAVVVDWVCDVDEHASTSCETTSGASHHDRRVIRDRVSSA